MLDFKRIRPLDAAIAGVAVVVFVMAVWLGWSAWSAELRVRTSTSVSRAVDDLAAAVRKNPNDLPARLNLAQALTVAGRTNDAIKQYQAVLSVDEENAAALSGLGFIAVRDGEYGTGEAYFRKVVDVQQGKGQAGESQLEVAYFYLGTALMEQKEYEEAAGYFKEALRLKRDASDTHYLLAVCLRELGYDDAYRESLLTCLLFDPRHPEANYDYAQVLLQEDDVAGAAEHFRASAEAAPQSSRPQEALAEFGTAQERIAAARKLRATDRGKALVEARVAVALDPRSVPALVVLGDLYADAGNEAKASEAYRKALGIDPENEAAKSGMEQVKDGS